MTARLLLFLLLALGAIAELVLCVARLLGPRARAWRHCESLRGTPRHAAALADYWRRFQR